jgi:hypothetical protein
MLSGSNSRNLGSPLLTALVVARPEHIRHVASRLRLAASGHDSFRAHQPPLCFSADVSAVTLAKAVGRSVAGHTWGSSLETRGRASLVSCIGTRPGRGVPVVLVVLRGDTLCELWGKQSRQRGAFVN